MLRTEDVTPTATTSLPHQHAVKFFVEHADLYSSLANYVKQAVGGGQGVFIAATRAHQKGLAMHLSGAELCLEELVERDQLVFVDAEQARQELMVKGKPSAARFETLIEEPIDQLRQKWAGVHVYDEITDLLAADSQFGPMRQLEQMWDRSRLERSFGLLSGYRLANFGEPTEEEPFDNVCRARQEVFAAGDEGGVDVARWQRRTFMLNNRLEQTQRELEQVSDELDQERKRGRHRSEFVGKFAHELRNPLAPMLSAVEMMNLRGDTTCERERGIIERQVSKLVDLVDDFVDSSRIMFDRAEMSTQHVETREIFERAVELAAPAIEEREHRLHVEVARTGLPLEADAERLAQAVGHLLDNAAHFTPEGGNIWLQAECEAGSIAIAVRDDGAGMQPELLDEVFEMFVRGEHGPDFDRRGMGLGLAKVRKIAESHDGAVAAYSDGPGQGSDFVIRLPLARPASTANPARVSRHRRGELAAGGRVLVVDDNEDFASMLSETLDLLGHDVRLANDANEALGMLSDFWPDVALLDINLPGMTGHELAEKLKQQADKRGELRLVAVTGYSDERKRKRSEEMGFDAHLVKPIVLSQLQETLDSVLEE